MGATDIKKNIKTAKKTATQAFTTDGWMNIVSGLGTSKDKNTYATINWTPTSREKAENLYAGDEMGAKISRIIPYDGTREGITWNMDKGVDQESVTKYLEAEFKRLRIWSQLAWAWTLARVYGGALLFISVNDGRSIDRPLNPDKVRQINTLTVIDRFEVNVTSTDINDDISSPNFGKPEFYNYLPGTSALGAQTQRIHHSRIIRLDGIRLPTRLYIENNYFHDSIFGALGTAIRNYSTVHDSIALIISDFNQPVYRIDGLTQALAMDEEELIVKKLQQVDLMRSAARAIVLDKEDEFQNVSTNVAGGKELIDLSVQRLVAGTDVPHTRLLGNSPSGLGATGQAELINYYDSVKSMQNTTLREPIEILSELIFSQKTSSVTKPEDLSFEFNPLFQQEREKEIKTREMQANIDEKYIGMGVITAEEVVDNRFGTGRYSFETVVEEGITRVSSFDVAKAANDDARRAAATAPATSDPVTNTDLDLLASDPTTNSDLDLM